jgi:predicted flavoprotein YhiN
MSSPSKNVAVIGAGPAGLMAAEVLAQGGAASPSTTRCRRPAANFLMAGRGGLNLTHSEPLPQFLARYREAMPHLAAPSKRSRRSACATERALGRRRLSAPAAGYFQKPSRRRPCCELAAAAGLDGRALALRHRWTGWDEQGRYFFKRRRTARHRDARNRARARRRKLAAAGLRRRVGGDLAAESVQISPLRPANSGFTVAGPIFFATASKGSRSRAWR